MAKFSIWSFLCDQWATVPIPNADISDKSVIITGANVGLGFEAAILLAKLKPKRLLLTTRDETRGSQAKHDVEQRSLSRNVEAWSLELSSFDSVRRFADRVQLEGFPVNALIANAAIATPTYARTQDGWETTLQVNYLSTALLSLLMLPHLIKTTTPADTSRLVIVSSSAHFLAHKFNGVSGWSSILGKLNDPEYCTASIMRRRYEVSKLLEIMFVRELATRLPNPTPVSITAIHPGFCHSRLTRSADSNPFLSVLIRVAKALVARTTEVGSRTLVHPAIEPGEKERHGRYVSGCVVTEESDYVLSEEGKTISRRLWTETIEVLERIDPRVNQIVSEHLLAR